MNVQREREARIAAAAAVPIVWASEKRQTAEDRRATILAGRPRCSKCEVPYAATVRNPPPVCSRCLRLQAARDEADRLAAAQAHERDHPPLF